MSRVRNSPYGSIHSIFDLQQILDRLLVVNRAPSYNLVSQSVIAVGGRAGALCKWIASIASRPAADIKDNGVSRLTRYVYEYAMSSCNSALHTWNAHFNREEYSLLVGADSLTRLTDSRRRQQWQYIVSNMYIFNIGLCALALTTFGGFIPFTNWFINLYFCRGLTSCVSLALPLLAHGWLLG